MNNRENEISIKTNEGVMRWSTRQAIYMSWALIIFYFVFSLLALFFKIDDEIFLKIINGITSLVPWILGLALGAKAGQKAFEDKDPINFGGEK